MPRILVALWLIGLFLLPINSVAQESTCAEDAETILQQNRLGVVIVEEGLVLYEEPNFSSEISHRLDMGDGLIVVDEPICEGDLVWWRIFNDFGDGWSLERVDGEALVAFVETLSMGIVIEDLVVDFDDLADDLVLELVPEFYWAMPGISPEAIRAEFVIEDNLEYRDPYLQIQPIEPIATFNPRFYDETFPYYETVMTGEVNPLEADDFRTPFARSLPLGPIMHLEYLRFGHGDGIRYVTTDKLFNEIITNENLLYVYEGISDDGAHYMRVIFAIDGEGVPATPDDVMLSDETRNALLIYNEQAVESIGVLTDQQFTPSLSALDALVQSISFQPKPEPEVTPEATEEGEG